MEDDSPREYPESAADARIVITKDPKCTCRYDDWMDYCMAICEGRELYDRRKDLKILKKRFMCVVHRDMWVMWDNYGLKTPRECDVEHLRRRNAEAGVPAEKGDVVWRNPEPPE